MRNCIDDNALVEFVEGTLPAEDSKRIESHVLRCVPCRRRLIAVGTSPSRIAAAPTAPAGVGAHLTLQPGTRVGRFEVRHEIGRGGMGIVFAARDPQLERSVALKLLHSASANAEQTVQAQERLLAEARAMARLGHSNIITVYEAGTFRHETYIAMELVQGETLNNWLRRWNRSWLAILDAFKQAARALGHAHEHGIAHGDFKPENVLIDESQRVRVTDFGLARWFGESPYPANAELPKSDGASGPENRRPMVMGTPRYMAPEQFAGRPADARSDQFSFCVALYEALYGRHPFYHDTALSLLKVPREQALAPMAEDADGDHGIPSWLHNVIVKGLSPDPGHRYASMRDLLQALEAPVARRPRPWVTTAMAAAMILVCLGGYSLGAWQTQPPLAAMTTPAGGDDGDPAVALEKREFGDPSADRDSLDPLIDGADLHDDDPVMRMTDQATEFGNAGHVDSSASGFITGLRTVLDNEIERVEERLDVLHAFRETMGWDEGDDFANGDEVGDEAGEEAGDQDAGNSEETGDQGQETGPRDPVATVLGDVERAPKRARKNGLRASSIERSINQRWRDLEVCYLEWRERQPVGKSHLRVRLRIDENGQGRAQPLSGLGDKVVRKCVAGALGAVSFPSARHSTVVELKFSLRGDKLSVNTRLQKYE